MQTVITRPELELLSRRLHGAASEVLRLSRSHLNEALARGYGLRTYAALSARFDAEEALRVDEFDYRAFVSRLRELSDGPAAEAVGVLADGIRISIGIAKRSEQRQRTGGFSDVAHDVIVEVRDESGALPGGSVPFLLPTFGSEDHEPYRVDSAHSFRVEDDYAVTRFQKGRLLLNAALVNGRWEGGLYVYSPEHQVDEWRCMNAVRAALVRAILPSVSPRGHCAIFQPDRYQFGAWRLELALGASARRYLGSVPLPFEIPRLTHRLIIPAAGYRRDVDVGLIVNGVWKADLYSNGVEESENPTNLEEVRDAYLSEVSSRLRRAGFTSTADGEQ
jgi:hypothetical protein